MTGPFATLTFDRTVAAPVATLWQVWTAPAARAAWAAPTPAVTVDFLQSDPREGGHEVSLCRVAGQPDIRCDVRWLVMQPDRRSICSELVACEGTAQSAALVTADFAATDGGTRLVVTVQLASLAQDMEPGYRQGFGAGLDHLAEVAARTMILRRVIKAPRPVVWGAWLNPETLPQWWGPDGFSCRTARIDLRSGGEWVFDMIAPDGTVFPNHHLYRDVTPMDRIGYALLWGENGPKHADAWVTFADHEGATEVTLGMVFSTAAEFQTARRFGAEALGQQTLAKLARFVGVA